MSNSLFNTTGQEGATGATGADGQSVAIEDEGTPLTTAATKIDFAGAGVTVTEPVTDEMLVTIPGASLPESVNAYEAGGGQVITAGPTTVQLDTVRGAPAGWAINGGDSLELTDAGKAGNYAIFARVGGEGALGTTRTNYDSFLTLNGSEIAGTRAEHYLRQVTFGATASLFAAPIALVLNDTIDIRLVRTSGSADFLVQPNGVSIVLVRVA